MVQVVPLFSIYFINLFWKKANDGFEEEKDEEEDDDDDGDDDDENF